MSTSPVRQSIRARRVAAWRAELANLHVDGRETTRAQATTVAKYARSADTLTIMTTESAARSQENTLTILAELDKEIWAVDNDLVELAAEHRIVRAPRPAPLSSPLVSPALAEWYLYPALGNLEEDDEASEAGTAAFEADGSALVTEEGPTSLITLPSMFMDLGIRPLQSRASSLASASTMVPSDGALTKAREYQALLRTGYSVADSESVYSREIDEASNYGSEHTVSRRGAEQTGIVFQGPVVRSSVAALIESALEADLTTAATPQSTQTVSVVRSKSNDVDVLDLLVSAAGFRMNNQRAEFSRSVKRAASLESVLTGMADYDRLTDFDDMISMRHPLSRATTPSTTKAEAGKTEISRTLKTKYSGYWRKIGVKEKNLEQKLLSRDLTRNNSTRSAKRELILPLNFRRKRLSAKAEDFRPSAAEVQHDVETPSRPTEQEHKYSERAAKIVRQQRGCLTEKDANSVVFQIARWREMYLENVQRKYEQSMALDKPARRAFDRTCVETRESPTASTFLTQSAPNTAVTSMGAVSSQRRGSPQDSLWSNLRKKKLPDLPRSI
ncbi:hypothetical protein LTR04_006629 [Oleoguttula sp. CCFEE 6159]|nr:hypothetical protein LTR04_006629 [Oleoguttula sp. CCFEE 6159]